MDSEPKDRQTGLLNKVLLKLKTAAWCPQHGLKSRTVQGEDLSPENEEKIYFHLIMQAKFQFSKLTQALP